MSKAHTERRRVLVKYNLNSIGSKTPEFQEETTYTTSRSFIESPQRSLDTHISFKLDGGPYHTSRASGLTRASVPKLSIARKSPDTLLSSFSSQKTIIDQIIVKASKIQQGLEKDRQKASRFLEVNAKSQKLNKLKNLSPITPDVAKATYHRSKQDSFYPTIPVSKTPPPRAKFSKVPLKIQDMNPEMLPQAKTPSENLESLKKLIAGFNQISRNRKG
jgi:hypothetical protein